MRALFFFALGGVLTLTLLAVFGLRVVEPWQEIFFIASVLLLVLWILVATFRDIGLGNRKEIDAAIAAGRVRAAMIVDRRQTGTFINEQPQVEFDLLVDRKYGDAFLAKARRTVPIIDVHETLPGRVVSVVHPDPDSGAVHFVEHPVPDASQELSLEIARYATELPGDAANSATGKRKIGLLITVVAFLAGGLVASLLSAPNAMSSGPGEAGGGAAPVEYASLFGTQGLNEALDVLIAETGHEEVFSVHFSNSVLHADVPIELGAQVGDSLSFQNQEVIRDEPMTIQPSEPDKERFSLEDVNWDAVIEGIPAAQDLAVELGLDDARLEHVHVSRSHIGLAPVEVALSFEGDYGSEHITLDASGRILPGEKLRLIPETERATYLFEPQAFDTALEEVLAFAGTDQAIDFMHQGDWIEMEAYESADDGTATITTITFRNGRIEGAEERPAANDEHAEVFDMREFDWDAVLGAIPSLQQLMADGGAVGTVPTHILARYELIPDGDAPVVVANVYLSNEAGDGGYVELDVTGEVRSVNGLS